MTTFNSLIIGGVISILPFVANSAELEAVLLGEFSNNSIDVTQMKPMAVLDLLTQNSQQDLTFTFQEMSMTRGWMEMPKLENACMYNKVKTPAREEMGYFSQYPITLYPPLRLIVRSEDAKHYSTDFDISSIQASQQMRYALAKNRSYGVLDAQIANKKQLLFFRDGPNSVEKLLEMLSLDRIDGFIEYADTVNAYISEHRVGYEIKSIPIKGVSKPSPGYMVCSKTDYGLQLINAIDKAMSQASFQQALISIHQEFASVEDKSLLGDELIMIFEHSN